MKIFFEEYDYPIERIQDTFDTRLYSNTNNGNNARLNAVGYYYSTKINDSVFILPKVFLFEKEIKQIEEKKEKKKKVIFAFSRYDPLDIIDIDLEENNPLKSNGDDVVIFELSMWLYLAIKQYMKRNEKSKIADENLITNIKSTGDHHSATYLDIILSLRKFNKEHCNLFTFISIINSRKNHKINWQKTINNVQPIITNNIPIYLEFKTINKSINYDEVLIVLFYSVLEFVKSYYHFKSNINLHYNLIKPNKIQSMIETKKGTRILKRIRHKFFKDELVALWNLLYSFFDISERIAAKNYPSEFLLAKKFNNVFEDMIDQLIGDEQDTLPDGLKDQPDGKRVDHIYSAQSLLDENLIFFIGDSKYYKDTTELSTNSIYKQFTYAKNVIQINLNFFLSQKEKKWYKQEDKEHRYRDNLTEGYNITPNFFIRGNVNPDELSYTEPQIKSEIENGKEIIRENYQFMDRLFDRDTLFTKEYNINFLYVLSSYAANSDNQQFRNETREIFRRDIIELLCGKYDENGNEEKSGKYYFYILEPIGKSLEMAIEMNFQLLHGKVYRPYDDCNYLIMAREKKSLAEEMKQKEKGMIKFTLKEKIAPYFYIYDYRLGEDVDGILEKQHKGREKLKTAYAEMDNFIDMVAAAERATAYHKETVNRVFADNAKHIKAIREEYNIQEGTKDFTNIEDEIVLVGFCKNQTHKQQILKTGLYYVRIGSINGSIHLIPGFDKCKYLFLHNAKEKLMLSLTGEGPRIFSGKDLNRRGFSVGHPDEFYLVFKLANTNPITFEAFSVDDAKTDGKGYRSAYSYFTTLIKLFKPDKGAIMSSS